ncbi:MAG: amino acid adenylation domain-containing protein, partial [Candidatus Delongbacteria bacterium]|nr:amino acid adenylation domain-containing protein [Candidatus Delongbacteria bacterium]
VLNLPYDYARPLEQSFEGALLSFVLEDNLRDKIYAICKETDTTLYMVLLSLFNILLSKLSGQEDIVVGVPIAGRVHSDLSSLIGMFVNTLAMRNYPKGELTYKDFLTSIKDRTVLSYSNQLCQFEDLVEELNVVRDLGRNPIFDVCLNLLDTEEGVPNLDDIHKKTRSKFDLSMDVLTNDTSIMVHLSYCVKLFNSDSIDRFAGYFKKIIEEITLETKLCDLDILSSEERYQLIYEFNDTNADYPRDKTIHQLFEEQVAKAPDNVALVFEDKEMTYGELNKRSNQIARLLREKGVMPDTIIGIMVDRSFEMIIGILGILKSGGAYLPIDPTYPEERIKYMLDDSRSKALLTQNHYYEDSKTKYGLVVIDLDSESSYDYEGTNLGIVNKPTDLAYVIYTSGTTGNPKGVMIEHLSVINTLYFHNEMYPMTRDDSFLLKTNFVFDVSVTELFVWVLNNNKLIILKQNEEKDPNKILNEVYKNKITHLNFVPSMFKSFVEQAKISDSGYLKSLKYILFAGEAISIGMLDSYEKNIIKNSSTINLGNIYGPTEATIYSSSFLIDTSNADNIPIGKPISNTQLFILSTHNSLQPIGVPGEICIGGVGLARGYLNNKELTREKFVWWDPETFKEYSEENKPDSAVRIYKTGDLGRWLPDGNIEFLGRIDDQVKIRGFRIELGEIESQLLQIKGIDESVVIAREDDSGDKVLVAYYVSNKEIENSIIRASLQRVLPDYMIPSFFMKLEAIPLTPNGKIDKRGLPAPDIEAGDNYVGPRNEVEEKLVDIWSEVLNLDKDKISINANFFDIGGNSLKLIALNKKIFKRLNKKFEMVDLFKLTTIDLLTSSIKGNEAIEWDDVERNIEDDVNVMDDFIKLTSENE